jgi:hypothetical protein
VEELSAGSVMLVRGTPPEAVRAPVVGTPSGGTRPGAGAGAALVRQMSLM